MRAGRPPAALAALAAGLAALPAWAGELDLAGPLEEGGLILGRTVPGATVRLDETPLRVFADGRFVFGLHRDAPETVTLSAELPDGGVVERRLRVPDRAYEVQRIDGLPPASVTPPAEVLARIRAEAAAVREARARDSALRGFEGPWIWPVDGTVTGVFGSQRILNGEPRRPHYGIDIAAPAGTPVVAPADGAVSFVGDLYFSGLTVMIDHGAGVASTFLHLERIDVAQGQTVHRGERIGAVGSTGRSTGPHLDWRVNWFQDRLDAALLPD